MLALSPSRRRAFVLGFALAGAVVAAFALSLRGDFLWDDDLHVTANPTIIGPLGLKEIWTTARANYFPLVLTNFWVQHALWELNPVGYHAVTIACHALAAVLLWRVLLALRVPGAWLGAALWALHPVQVESVAWICELKNTQSAVFFLAAILFWIRWLEAGRVVSPPLGREGSAEGGLKPRPTARMRRRVYVLALLCGLCAILSKPSTVMLPIALGLCTWWLQRRLVWRDIYLLVPFFALSALAAGWTIWEQKHHSGAIGPEWSQTLPERIAIAGRVVWFYLGKLAWPDPLIFIYPRWQIDAADPRAYVPVAAVLVTLLVLWWRRERECRPVLFSAVYFGALLFPVLGFFSVYFFRYSFVGDHFQYLASMGPLALAAAGVMQLRPSARGAIGGALVLALGVTTAVQCRVYRNNETLWRDTVAKNPAATMAWLNLGDTLVRAEKYEEAIATFRRALDNKPTDHSGWNDLGNVLVLVGRADEAVVAFERALALKPDFVEAHSNLGNALRALGRSDAAIASYQRALALTPDNVEALNNLGAELAETNRPTEAVPIFERILRLNPKHAGAHDNLGNALRVLGRVDEAIRHHTEALRVKPDYAEAHINLGRALLAANRAQDAAASFERGLALKPSLIAAYANYASALAAAGRPDAALAQLERAVSLAPNSVAARGNLGTALAQTGRLREALTHFEVAVQLEPRSVPARMNLATALGSAGRWREAIAHLRSAIEVDAKHAVAHAQLAVALVNSEQLPAAVPVFETALRLDPGSAELHDNFAQLLRALGRNREAFEHLEQAADLRRAKR